MKIHVFRKNFKPTRSAEIRYKRPTSLNEACTMAIEYEDSAKEVLISQIMARFKALVLKM